MFLNNKRYENTATAESFYEVEYTKLIWGEVII